MTQPQYSHLFSCLYDQPEPVGRLGRGAHHSVFRSVQWRDIDGKPRGSGRIHDFAVIWDEDHDTRVIDVIERLHLAALMWPVVFVGERKGVLTILVEHGVVPDLEGAGIDYYERVRNIAGAADDTDNWTCEFGWFHRNEDISEPSMTSSSAIIADEDARTVPYLEAIDALWRLGEKPGKPASTWWKEA